MTQKLRNVRSCLYSWASCANLCTIPGSIPSRAQNERTSLNLCVIPGSIAGHRAQNECASPGSIPGHHAQNERAIFNCCASPVLLLGTVRKTSAHSLSGLHGRYVSGSILVRALTAEESENSGGAAGRSPILTRQAGIEREFVDILARAVVQGYPHLLVTRASPWKFLCGRWLSYPHQLGVRRYPRGMGAKDHQAG